VIYVTLNFRADRYHSSMSERRVLVIILVAYVILYAVLYFVH
jgi:hypothetical protein